MGKRGDQLYNLYALGVTTQFRQGQVTDCAVRGSGQAHNHHHHQSSPSPTIASIIGYHCNNCQLSPAINHCLLQAPQAAGSRRYCYQQAGCTLGTVPTLHRTPSLSLSTHCHHLSHIHIVVVIATVTCSFDITRCTVRPSPRTSPVASPIVHITITHHHIIARPLNHIHRRRSSHDIRHRHHLAVSSSFTVIVASHTHRSTSPN